MTGARERERLTVHAALCRAGAGRGWQWGGGRKVALSGQAGGDGRDAKGQGLPGLHLVFQEKSKPTTTKDLTHGYTRGCGCGRAAPSALSLSLSCCLKKSETPNCLPAANICCFQSSAWEHQTCKKLINGNTGN